MSFVRTFLLWLAVVALCVIIGFQLSWNGNEYNISGLQAPSNTTSIFIAVTDTPRFTLITQVYNRVQTLHRWVQHYSSSPSLDAIVIIWNTPIPAGFTITAPVPIINYQCPNNSMNNRFLPRDGIRTDAVFLIDDDLYITPKKVEFAFSVWTAHPTQLVGFLPRAHQYNHTKGAWQYKSSALPDGQYSMVLAGASVFHKSYLERYSAPQLQPWRAVVDKAFNCDDILLNIIIANHSQLPPLVVEGTVIDRVSPQRGLSSQPGWKEARNKCLNIFAAFTNGSLPLRFHNLVVTSRKAGSLHKFYYDSFYRHPEMHQPYASILPSTSTTSSYFDESLVTLNDNYLSLRSNPWTIEFWLGASLLRTFQAILGMNAERRSALLIGLIQLRIVCCCPSLGLIQSLRPFSKEGLSHVAVVYDTANCSLYVNGEPEPYSIAIGNNTVHRSCVSNSPANQFSTLSIGSLYKGQGTSLVVRNSFEGFLQELRVWSVARTKEDLLASYLSIIERHAKLHLRIAFGRNLTDSTRQHAVVIEKGFSAAYGVPLSAEVSAPIIIHKKASCAKVKQNECKILRSNGVALVLPSFVRPDNIPQILLHTARFFQGPLNEVIIVNSNPNISFNVTELAQLFVDGNSQGFPSEPSHCTITSPTFPQVTVLNSAANLNTKAKYVGCLSSRQPVCFIQDDDFYPTLSNTLYSSFLLEPDTIHVETDVATYLMNRKWTFIDSEIGLETGFAWFGCGSFKHRNTAARILGIMERFNISPHVMDPSAAILLNKIPVVYPTVLNSTGLTLDGGFACPSCDLNRKQIEEARSTALQILVSHLSQHIPDDDFHRAASTCTYFCKRVALTGCSSDRCMLLSNVDIIEPLIARINFSSLNGSYSHLFQRGRIGGLRLNSTTTYRNAVDEQLNTSWSPPRDRVRSGSWFGLDLLRVGTFQQLSMFYSEADSLDGRVVLEGSCSLEDFWVPIHTERWIWATESLYPSLGIRYGLATFNTTKLRNIRIRFIAPLAAQEAFAIHELSVS